MRIAKTAVKKLALSLILLFMLPNGALGEAGAVQSCDAMIEQMHFVTSQQVCRATNSNWACYGQAGVLALPADVRFDRPRDRQPLTALQSITTEHPSGIVVMRVKSTAAPVNLVMIGDTNVAPTGVTGFVMRIEGNELVCDHTPSGMVLQTESDQLGRVTINGVEIELGSTAFVTMPGQSLMTIVNLEGRVRVAVPNSGVWRTIKPGTQVGIVYTDNKPTWVGQPIASALASSPLLAWVATAEDGLRASGIEALSNEPQCAVVAAGLNLRAGPGQNYEPPLRVLSMDTRARPVGLSQDGNWIVAEVEGTGMIGWFSAAPQYVVCNVAVSELPVATPPPTFTPTPTATPIPTRIEPTRIEPTPHRAASKKKDTPTPTATLPAAASPTADLPPTPIPGLTATAETPPTTAPKPEPGSTAEPPSVTPPPSPTVQPTPIPTATPEEKSGPFTVK